jgi:hypothetical protein
MATASRTAKRRVSVGPKEELYNWEGKDKTGKIIRGEMRATGDAIVQATLRRQGVLVTKVKKQKMSRGHKITEKDIALFTRQLATMMKSGVPLLQAFEIGIKGSGNPSLARMLNEVRTDVETGSSLSQAFSRHPVHFDKLFCNLVAAGEQAGILDNLLDRIASRATRPDPDRHRNVRLLCRFLVPGIRHHCRHHHEHRIPVQAFFGNADRCGQVGAQTPSGGRHHPESHCGALVENPVDHVCCRCTSG